jgi:hypothetical protein
MVAQVFNLCTGGVLLFPGGTGFLPVNPLRIIGVAGLNYRVRDGIGRTIIAHLRLSRIPLG